MIDKLSPKGKNYFSLKANNNNEKNIELNSLSEINNKSNIDYSFLINKIIRNNKSLLEPIENNKKGLFMKRLFLTDKQKQIIKKNKSCGQKDFTNIYKYEEFPIKIKLPKKINDSEKSISLSSLFNLPKVKLRNKLNIRQKVVKNNNFSLNLHKKKTLDISYNPKIKNFFSVKNFMKEKFYSDIENKYDHLIKTKYFRNDPAIKQEIIKAKKVGIFWNRFFEYCGPIIKVKRYQALRKILTRNKIKKDSNLFKSHSVNNPNVKKQLL